jgi:hypothetical protein
MAIKLQSAIQEQGYEVIRELRVLEHLERYHATVVGTLPLDLFIPGQSDIDIICTAYHFDTFKATLTDHFSRLKGFELVQKFLHPTDSVVCRFCYQSFPFEIVGQPLPVTEQWAYKHLYIEQRLLNARGSDFKAQILQLKKQGIKTEPAFAQALKLSGNPYEALLHVRLLGSNR